MVRNCITCGEEFKRRPSHVKRGGGLFCTLSCRRHSIDTINKMRLNHSNKRWEGHVHALPIKRKRHFKKEFGKSLEKKRFRNQRYKAVKKQAEGSHTFGDWENLKRLYNYMCLCCKRFEPEIKLTEDHIFPLSLGGSDAIENIQPLCQVCNTRKHARYISYLPTNLGLVYGEEGSVN